MLSRLDGLVVWRNPEVKRRLSWYYEVMKDYKPAKFLICKTIPCHVDLTQASDDQLWGEHERCSAVFHDRLNDITAGRLDSAGLATPTISYLELKAEIIRRILKHCTLCEWHCRVDRFAGKKLGACHMDVVSRVSTWFHHFGEEPPLVGAGGSGTIFFAGCVFRCVFCQNWDISQDHLSGVPVDGRRLALIMKELRREGASNINFVGGEPTPNLHVILDGMRLLAVNVPMLWNSDMYMSQRVAEVLLDVIDIWLPDFKYGNDRCALRLSKVMNYFGVVSRNHRLAQGTGDMIVRHLVMPNHVECCTRPVLKWLSENCPRALVNVMGQYHPDYLVAQGDTRYLDISRRVSNEEMREAFRIADDYGLIYEPVS